MTSNTLTFAVVIFNFFVCFYFCFFLGVLVYRNMITIVLTVLIAYIQGCVLLAISVWKDPAQRQVRPALWVTTALKGWDSPYGVHL